MKIVRFFEKRKGGVIKSYVSMLGVKVRIGERPDEPVVTPEQFTAVLNAVVDIRSVPKARGPRRILQNADLQLLKMFDRICQREKIPYFLQYGTLLGCIRHGGFIPWDDDLDVMVPTDAYTHLVETLERAFCDLPFRLYGLDETRCGNTTLRITHRDIPALNLDVFTCYPIKAPLADLPDIEKECLRLKAWYAAEFAALPAESREALGDLRTRADASFGKVAEICTCAEATAFASHVSSPYAFVLPAEEIMPLRRAPFEGFEAQIPNNPEIFLKKTYGDYNSFPRDFFKHADFFMDFDPEALMRVLPSLERVVETL